MLEDGKHRQGQPGPAPAPAVHLALPPNAYSH